MGSVSPWLGRGAPGWAGMQGAPLPWISFFTGLLQSLLCPCPSNLTSPGWRCVQGGFHSHLPGPGRGSWVLGALPLFGSGWSLQVDAGGERTLQIRWGQIPTTGGFRMLPRNQSFPLLPFHCSSSIHPSWLLQLPSLAVHSRVDRNLHTEGEWRVGGASRHLPAPHTPLPSPSAPPGSPKLGLKG